MSKYRIEKVKDFEEWDTFVIEKSINGNVFALTDYLNNIGLEFEINFVKKGNDIRAGFYYLHNKKNIVLDDLIIYEGLLFISNDKISNTRNIREHFEITEVFIDYITNKFDSIIFQTTVNFVDLRPFLWYNYHSNNNSEKFKIDIKHTSFLDIKDLFYKKSDEKSKVFQRLDNERKRDIKRASEKLVFLKSDINTSLFIDYYKLTLEKNGIIKENSFLDRMFNLIEETTKKGMLIKYGVKNRDNKITYIVVFSIFNNIGTYLFGAGNPNIMDRYDATYCLWNAFKNLNHNYGIDTIDLEGVNSPQRGWFKLSFGGDIRPYYEIKLNKKD